jgi:hypothetical protein
MITPEQIADEEARAQLWRDQARRRVAYQEALWYGTLAGDPVALTQLHAAWAPVELWLLERQEPELLPEDDPSFDPLGLSDSLNVGT